MRNSSNRTFMELKWQPRRHARKQKRSSNRTFMELKLKTEESGVILS